jgi:hypothetical protein
MQTRLSRKATTYDNEVIMIVLKKEEVFENLGLPANDHQTVYFDHRHPWCGESWWKNAVPVDLYKLQRIVTSRSLNRSIS